MTRYILDKRYRLRGWYKLPTGIYDTSRRKAVFFDPKVYELLLKCDADYDFDEDSLSDDQKRMLGKLVKEKIIRKAGSWMARMWSLSSAAWAK